jgi:predicted RNase H-like nuclease (RuvC/YqgF family)
MSSCPAKIEALSEQLTAQDKTLQEGKTKEAALSATVEQMHQQIEAQQAELERVHSEAVAERQARKQEAHGKLVLPIKAGIS